MLRSPSRTQFQPRHHSTFIRGPDVLLMRRPQSAHLHMDAMPEHYFLFVCHRVRDLALPNEPSLMAQCCDCRATVWAPIKIYIPHEVVWVCEPCAPSPEQGAHAE